MRLKLAALVVLLAVGVGAVAYVALGVGTQRASTSQYLTAQVDRQDVVDEVAATGSVTASASYHLAFGSPPVDDPTGSASSSSTSGSSAGSVTWNVDKVDVAVGDSVKKGQVLATASSTDLEAQLVNAKRSVGSAKISQAVAQANLDGATTTAAIRQATIALYAAQNQLADARTTVGTLESMRGWNALTAPADGVVTGVSIEAGATAPSGDAVVMQSAVLEVTGNVVEGDVPSVKTGQSATVSIEALGLDVPGTVSAIAPSAAASSGNSVVTFAVTVTLTSPPVAVRVGMSAQVSITVARSVNALAIPTAALGGTTGSYEVRVLGADGQVTTVPVSVGLVTSTLAEITSGLSERETVITGTTSQLTTTGTGGFGGGGFGGGGQRIVVPGGNP